MDLLLWSHVKFLPGLVVIGGDVYSEAIIIDRFVVEDDQARIDSLEFGRP